MKKKVILIFLSFYIALFSSATIFFLLWKTELKIQEKNTEKYGDEFVAPCVKENKL